MATVVALLAAPMQSWGTTSYAEERRTQPVPTKSGVCGLIANCLGWTADTDTAKLDASSFAVRADRPGHEMTDQQTAGAGTFPLDALTHATEALDDKTWLYGKARKPEPDRDGILRSPWTETERTAVLLDKSYLADAAFLVSLSHPDLEWMHRVWEALNSPARLPFLGRRACPPAAPLAYRFLEEETTETGTVPAWCEHLPLIDQVTRTAPEVWYETTHTGLMLPTGVPNTYTYGHRTPRTMRMDVTRTKPAGSEVAA